MSRIPQFSALAISLLVFAAFFHAERGKNWAIFPQLFGKPFPRGRAHSCTAKKESMVSFPSLAKSNGLATNWCHKCVPTCGTISLFSQLIGHIMCLCGIEVKNKLSPRSNIINFLNYVSKPFIEISNRIPPNGSIRIWLSLGNHWSFHLPPGQCVA